MLTPYSSTIPFARSFLISGSRVFFDDLLEYPIIQRQIRIHLLKLAVLFLEFLQPFDLADLHTAVLALPVVECGSGYAMFSCDGLGINAAFKLLDGLHHLRLTVDLLFYTVLPKTKLILLSNSELSYL